MVKSQNRNLRAAIGLIFMLAASPLTVTYVQADVAEDTDSLESKSIVRERERTILAEKIVDGKLQVRHFEVPENASSDEIHQALMFDEETHGWAYVNGKAYNSGIVLFNGKAIKVSEYSWKSSDHGITVGDKNMELELSGRAQGQNVLIHGTTSNDELQFRIVLSGNITQSGEGNSFAVAFIHAGLKISDNGETIKLHQLGQITVESPVGEKLETKNSILVA